MTRSYRRKRILIDELQYRLLGINLFYFLVILLLLAAFLFTPLALQLRIDSFSVATREEVADQFLTLHERIWPALLMTFGLLAVHSVVISLRIAGPLYHFRSILKSLRDGDLTVRATIRSTDYLRQEAVLFNELIDALRARVKNIAEQSWQLRAGLGALAQAIDGSTVDKLRERIGSLEAGAERLQGYLDQFTTEAEEGRANERVAGHAAIQKPPVRDRAAVDRGFSPATWL